MCVCVNEKNVLECLDLFLGGLKMKPRIYQVLPAAGESGALDLPLYWPDADRSLLMGCSTRRFEDLNDDVAQDFAWLDERVFCKDRAAFPAHQFGAEQWAWAVGVAISRSFFVQARAPTF